ncbi:MAG TPA: patatin-like phospholipase family protein [Bacteroidia bacterium]|nr:patatin-like phospholipase family protein [Bacteroidia bacterium]
MANGIDHPVQVRLAASGPKRILALDGGGIRGAITLGFLVQLEAHLRKRHGNPNLLLRDYFDLIGGTSTGSIIAASLAIGMNASDILAEYGNMGDRIFEHPAKFWQVPKWIRQNLFYRNKPAAIESILQQFYTDKQSGKEYTLGDPLISTGLCIVTKRVDTFSVWSMHNNPKGKYYPENKDLPLWRIVRASSAAPTFFPPTIFAFDQDGQEGAFVDGGVSMSNNPSTLLYFMATLKGYRIEWPTGADKLMIVSIGTGTSEVEYAAGEVRKLGKKSALFWGGTVPDMFIRDASEYNEMLLQGLSESPTARKIDGEVGTLAGDHIAGSPRLHYLRYNVTITAEDIALNARLTDADSKKYPKVKDVADMMRMDAGNHVFHLAEIGKRAADRSLGAPQFEAHFPKTFDITKS